MSSLRWRRLLFTADAIGAARRPGLRDVAAAAAPPARASRPRYDGWWKLLAIPLPLYLLLPLAALLARTSPAQALAKLGRPEVLDAVRLSLGTTLLTVALTVLLGTPVAYWLAQRRSRARRLVDAVIDLPTVLPPAVAGLALLMAFGRRGLLGAWLEPLGISLAFTPLAVVLAQSFVAAPFYVKAATIGFAGVQRDLKQAAAIDGADRLQTFRYITLPLARSALFSGSATTWARALGEFGATIVFAGNFPGRTQTMPLSIYLGLQLDLDAALALSVIMIGFSLPVLLIVRGLAGREPDTLPEA